jgi:hypothetical protein
MADEENALVSEEKRDESGRFIIPPLSPGRPKGSRNKLGEAFLEALHDDFKEHGVKAIADVRKDKPDQYLKVIASTLPKELNLKVSELDELTDDQIQRQLAAGLAALAAAGFDPFAGVGQETSPQPTAELSTLQ